MGFPLLGALVSGAASLIGGALDNKRAKKNREAEEARLRAATGYDFERLRDQAQAAGFNPLTVLQATGGAGYDGRGAVVSQPYSPFIQSSLSGAANAFFDLREADRRFDLDKKRDDVLSREIDNVGRAFATSSPFGTKVRAEVGPHVTRKLGQDFGPVMVRSILGKEYLDPLAAESQGLSYGDWMTEGMRADLQGEFGGELTAGVGYVLQASPFLGGSPFAMPPKASIPRIGIPAGQYEPSPWQTLRGGY